MRGGVIRRNGKTEMTLFMSGGKSYKRVFHEEVESAIERFSVVEEELSKILGNQSLDKDEKFFVTQLQELLKHAHVQLVPGKMPYQVKHNMSMLDKYVRMLFAGGSLNLKLVVQLLNIDSILYYIEEAKKNNVCIQFQVPRNLTIRVNEKDLMKPQKEETQEYIRSLVKNLHLLVKALKANKQTINEIHDVIIKAAKKQFR